MINNPYIDLVKQHDKILTLESEIYDRAGKWSDIFENLNEIVLEIGTGL
jgi:tRNA G46 methylase TrmB